jgi:hypothetical protein
VSYFGFAITICRRTRSVGIALTVVAAILLATACAPKGGSRQQDGPAAEDGYSHLNPDEKVALSDVLVDESEEKLGFLTMLEHGEKMQEALKLNPNNFRAKFWYELTQPFGKLRGIVGRVRPLYMKQPMGLERYQNLVSGLEQNSTPDYFRFLTELDEKTGRLIENDADFRAWMDELLTALNGLRLFIRDNKDRNLELRMPQRWVFPNSNPDRTDGRCGAFSFHSITKLAACSRSGMVSFRLNRADFEVVQYAVSAQLFHMAFLYSFNLNPLVALDGFTNRRPNEIVAMLTKGYDGKLLSNNKLHLGNEIFPEWLAAQKYFRQNQQEVCKHGDYNPRNRPGYLMAFGFCIRKADLEEHEKATATLEALVQGKPISIGHRFVKGETIDVKKFIASPPESILPLMPTSFTFDGEMFGADDSAYQKYFGVRSMTAVLLAQEKERQYDMLMMFESNVKFTETMRIRLNEYRFELGLEPIPSRQSGEHK